MIFYLWTALNQNDREAWGDCGPSAPGGGRLPASSGAGTGHAGSPVAMGITDDRGRAMRAGEETLRSGLAAVVIIEAVRPAMAAGTLASCYVRTGAGWLGRRTEAGGVAWSRFFPQAGRDDRQPPGRMGS